jgi:ubiquinone biosynthesis protein COQ4
MVAALTETTAGPSLPRLRDMLESADGRQIIKKRPRVNSQAVDMDRLSQFPEGANSESLILFTEMTWRKGALRR